MVMKTIVLSLAFACFARAQTTFQPAGASFRAPVTVASGYSAHVIFSNLTAPRGITFDSENNLLVVERGFGVTAFTPTNTPSAGYERTVVFEHTGLTQGIQVDGNKLYVTTATEALVYDYDPATKTVASSPPYPTVTGIPGDGELTTHTIELEKNANGDTIGLLIGSGPLTNIDPTARDPANGRSQVRRFLFPEVQILIYPPPPLSWSSGQVIAYGIRNPGGFAFTPGSHLLGNKRLAIVENGASIDNAPGMTTAFANDNPADEINIATFPASPSTLFTPKSYGFPDCTPLWNPQADPVGVPQFVSFQRGDQFSLNIDPTFDQAWCEDPANNEPPSYDFQSHSVPLDIKFYTLSTWHNGGPNRFPASRIGDAFVSFRGSFNRIPPTGYGVVRVPFLLGHPLRNIAYSFLIQATDLNTCPGSCIRPVGLAFGVDGRLYVSSDSSREIFVIERDS
ncbi:hypothetical protein AX16_010981 [Volvariella volvacea WC 439]|nr:hypothetical protein AX16_010981 [Volvariella volvacea WC 439]